MPIHIRFDLNDITPEQARALSAMLKVIEGEERDLVNTPRPNFRETNRPVAITPGEIDTSNAVVFDRHPLAEAAPGAVEVTNVVYQVELSSPTEVLPLSTDEPPKKRGRRTKAEMEAAKAEPASTASSTSDEFTHLLAILNDQMDAARRPFEERKKVCEQWMELGEGRIEDLKLAIEKNKAFLAGKTEAPKAEEVKPPAEEAPQTEEPKPPTGEDLRNALNAYIASHDFDAGLALVAKFGGVRVSDLEKKPLADQLEFIKVAHA